MKYKNITKKNIIIIANGIKQVIKPKQIVDGDRNVHGQYSGLLLINKSSSEIIQPQNKNKELLLNDFPQIEEIIIDEKTESTLRKVSDISIDFIIVDNIT
jgi:hypothetical protein